LEFRIAADTIDTVAIEPTVQSLLMLAGIVLIRMVLSFSFDMEIDGRCLCIAMRPITKTSQNHSLRRTVTIDRSRRKRNALLTSSFGSDYPIGYRGAFLSLR
jgi:hypothetical protein